MAAVVRFFFGGTSPSTRASFSSFQNPHQKLCNFSAPSLFFCTSTTLSSLSSHSLVAKARKTPLFDFSAPPPSPESTVATVENPVLESDTEEEEVSKTRLCAQNVPWTCTADDVRALFQKHGTVLDVELSMHNKIKSRGLAFVAMGSEEEALAALTNLESSEFEGRTLKVNYARARKKKSKMTSKFARRHDIFVANLSFDARDKDLREFFDAGNGNVVSAEVVFHDNPKRHSGYGYVSFGSKAEAQAALTAFQGKMFMGRPIKVEPTRRLPQQEPGERTKSEDALTDLNPEVKAFRGSR